MGVLSRINDIIRSNLNDLVSKAENPEKLLEQAILDMETHIRKARKQVLETLAAEKQMEIKRLAVIDTAQRWERRAALALHSEQEDLAKQALVRRAEQVNYAFTLEEQVRVQREYVGALKQSLVALEERLRDARNRKNALIARAKAARARKKVISTLVPGKAAKGMGGSRAFETFDRMEDKIMALEAQAEAYLEMSQTDSVGGEDPGLDAKFSTLEKDQDIEKQLSQMKKQLAKGSQQKGTKNPESN